MLLARLICSDEACAERFEAAAATLAELVALACDCGCALQVLGWPDSIDDGDGGAGGRDGGAGPVLVAAR
ncbi:MAG TPA: hypothetical protein VLA98_01860 [Solirubrobacteraceae bacterium]|nr:hypothetical protein [Solirubrobacteraceae bacterium]